MGFLDNNGVARLWAHFVAKIQSLTPDDIGAVAKTGDTMTGDLEIDGSTTQKSIKINRRISGYTYTEALQVESNGNAGVYLNKDDSTVNSLVLTESSSTLLKPLTLEGGGTGANTKAGARTNMGIASGTSLPDSGEVGDIFFLYSE